MIIDAPAKINLSLRVLARETSGFHQIESLFCALELCDEVEAERAVNGIRIDVRGDEDIARKLSDDPADNLVFKAATKFFDASGLDGGADITLTKRIPSGAGLGGGSSDAAATLAVLNELYARPLQARQLIKIAAKLGSDIPFFLCGSPLALAWGRGTRMTTLAPLSGKAVLLVAPNEAVATAEAYNELAKSRDSTFSADAVVYDAITRSTNDADRWTDVAYNAVNDFEPIIFSKIPELAQIKADLARHGATIALLTGSGSVVYGVFPSEQAARSAERAIRQDFRNVRTILTRTASRDISLSAPPPSLT